MYLTGLPTMGHIAAGGSPARKSGYRLDPSDPEYARIRREAAELFDDPTIAADVAPVAQQPAEDLGDQIVALMMQKRGKTPPVPATGEPATEGDLGDQIVALMRAKRGQR